MLMDGLTFIGGADNNYDIAGSTLSKPTDAAVLMRFSVNRPFRLPAGLTGSNAESTVAPTAAKSYPIKKNGASIGSIDFALGANDATFTFAANVDFVVDDYLTVEAPATADATHDGLAWTFKTVSSV